MCVARCEICEVTFYKLHFHSWKNLQPDELDSAHWKWTIRSVSFVRCVSVSLYRDQSVRFFHVARISSCPRRVISAVKNFYLLCSAVWWDCWIVVLGVIKCEIILIKVDFVNFVWWKGFFFFQFIWSKFIFECLSLNNTRNLMRLVMLCCFWNSLQLADYKCWSGLHVLI